MKFSFTFFIVLTLFSLSAFGQLTTNRISGTVAGPDGLVPGAMVKIKSNVTNQEITAITDSKGSFSTNNLEVGSYEITITANGFKTFTAQKVQLEIGKEFSLDAVLEIGGVSEVVNVTVGQELVNSVDGKISNGVSRKQLDDLPSLGRNPLNFVPLQAGAASNPSQLTVINGVRTSATNTTIDGINVQDNFIRSNATDFSPARPTVDEVEEFAVSGQNSVDDGFGGAQIQFATRRGGNQFNFRLFEFNRNSKLAANSFFNNANGVARPFRNRNQFGGNVGGPIIKEKLFFFGAYEQLIDRVPAATQTNTILTSNARQGIFTYTANANDAVNGVTAGQLVTVNLLNPALGTGITAINPLILSRFLNNIPTAGNSTLVGDQRNTTGFSVVQNANAEQFNYVGRIDYILNPRNNITGTFRYVKQDVNRSDIDNSFSVVPRVTQPSKNPFLSLGWTSSITSKFSNDLRGGFFFSDPIFLRSDANPTSFVAPTLITDPVVGFQNQGRDTKTFNLQDNASYVLGSHSLRFGGQWQRVLLDTFNDAGIVPTYNLGTTANTPQISTAQFMNTTLFPGGVPQAQRGGANALLALLGGIVGSGSAQFNVQEQLSGFIPGATNRRLFDYHALGFYITDQWKIRENLSVNFGLRYDYYTALRSRGGLFLEPVITDANNPLPSLLDPNGTYQFIGGNSRVPNTFYRPDRNNFSPNVSVVYSPNVGGFAKYILGNKPVFRGGYRNSYINDELVRAPDNALSGNQGLAFTSNVLNPITGTTALNARIDSLPAVPTPTFVANRTFALNNQAAGLFGTVFGIDPNLQSPLIHEYSFGYQREVGFDTVVEIRYVGTQSDNLLRGIDFNQVDIRNNGFLADFNRARGNLQLTGNAACTVAQNAGCQALTVFPNVGSGGLLTNATVTANLTAGTPADLAIFYVTNNLSGTVPFLPNRNAGVVDLLTNGSRSNYNSVQVDVRRRFTQGLSLNANYTFSKSLTDGVGTAQTRFEPFLDNQNQGLDYSRADFDQTHKLNITSTYELPFGKGKYFLNQGGLLNYLVGGFQLGGILQIGSGAPITITDARGTLNRAGRAGRQTALTNLSESELGNLVGNFVTSSGVFFLNPSVLGRNSDGTLNATGGGTGRGANGFGTNAFTGQVFFNNAPGQVGGLRRAIFNGPTTYILDLSLIKRFNIGEKFTAQIQADAFNVFNTVNFIPGQFLDINGTNFGRITATTAPRITQLAFRLNF